MIISISDCNVSVDGFLGSTDVFSTVVSCFNLLFIFFDLSLSFYAVHSDFSTSYTTHLFISFIPYELFRLYHQLASRFSSQLATMKLLADNGRSMRANWYTVSFIFFRWTADLEYRILGIFDLRRSPCFSRIQKTFRCRKRFQKEKLLLRSRALVRGYKRFLRGRHELLLGQGGEDEGYRIPVGPLMKLAWRMPSPISFFCFRVPQAGYLSCHDDPLRREFTNSTHAQA